MKRPNDKTRKILIVEDNKLDQKAITRTLDKQGLYQYTVANNLKEAREKLREITFEIVLLDYNLPDGKGSELFAELASIPFVMATGAGSEARAVQAYQSGASDYIIKDVDGFYLQLLPSTFEKALKHKELEQLKENFIGTVSHELRTPLTVIGAGISNLKDGIVGPISEKQAEVLEISNRNVKYLGKLIDNLLDISRLQSGRTKIDKKEVDLKHLIHEVIESFQQADKKAGALIEEEIATKLPPLECDPDLIEQVLTNLLSNAIQYAKKSIMVKVEVTKGADGTCADGALSFIQTSVSNDGPGIAPESLSKLFNKFVQLDRENHKNSYKGTGLGLAISKEIIEEHHGKIWVESPGKKGVAFYFTLPILPAG